MSTLYVDDVAGQGGGTAANLMSGLAKVHAVYDQTAPATDRGDNVSSISDDATGYWTVNFSNIFDAVDYGHSAWAYSTAVGHAALECGKANGDTWTTAATQMGTYYTVTAGALDTENALQVYGDLA